MNGAVTLNNDAALKLIPEMVRLQKIGHLITISGGTCSGKTRFAMSLKRMLDATRSTSVNIHLDSYFRDWDDPILPEQDNRKIFDMPESYHRHEFVSDISQLLDGKMVDVPIYEIATNRRVGYAVATLPTDIVIAEGLFASSFLAEPHLGAFHVYMETPIDECLQRRIARDTALYNLPESRVREMFEREILPLWHLHQQSEKSIAHLIVDDKNERN